MFDDCPHISKHFIGVEVSLGLTPQNHVYRKDGITEEDKEIERVLTKTLYNNRA